MARRTARLVSASRPRQATPLYGTCALARILGAMDVDVAVEAVIPFSGEVVASYAAPLTFDDVEMIRAVVEQFGPGETVVNPPRLRGAVGAGSQGREPGPPGPGTNARMLADPLRGSELRRPPRNTSNASCNHVGGCSLTLEKWPVRPAAPSAGGGKSCRR